MTFNGSLIAWALGPGTEPADARVRADLRFLLGPYRTRPAPSALSVPSAPPASSAPEEPT